MATLIDMRKQASREDKGVIVFDCETNQPKNRQQTGHARHEAILKTHLHKRSLRPQNSAGANESAHVRRETKTETDRIFATVRCAGNDENNRLPKNRVSTWTKHRKEWRKKSITRTSSHKTHTERKEQTLEKRNNWTQADATEIDFRPKNMTTRHACVVLSPARRKLRLTIFLQRVYAAVFDQTHQPANKMFVLSALPDKKSVWRKMRSCLRRATVPVHCCCEAQTANTKSRLLTKAAHTVFEKHRLVDCESMIGLSVY